MKVENGRTNNNDFNVGDVKEIPINSVKVIENVRTSMDSDELSELMQNIKHNGLLHDIGVFKSNNEYILGFGHRRLTACRKLGWKTIPAKMLGDLDNPEDLLLKNMSENLHRKSVTVAEMGRLCDLLRRQGLSRREIATRLSIPDTRVKVALELFENVPKDLREDVVFIESGHGRKGKIGAHTYKEIASIDRNLSLNKKQVGDIIRTVKKDDIPLPKLRLLGTLLKSGLSVDKSLRTLKDFETLSLTLPVNTKVMKETLKAKGMNPEVKGNYGKLLRDIITGKHDGVKNLIAERT